MTLPMWVNRPSGCEGRAWRTNKETVAMATLDVFDMFTRDYAREKFESMSLRDWLLAARDDKMLYASPAERMVEALGEPELVDTAQDSRLSRIFFNRTIKVYPAFSGFFGMEDTIERIVGYF